MSDTKWGFDTNYGHRTLPFKWQSSNGFHFYEDSRLRISHFREASLLQNYLRCLRKSTVEASFPKPASKLLPP